MVAKYAQVMEFVLLVCLDLTLTMESALSVLLLAKPVIMMELVQHVSRPSQPLLTPMVDASLALLLTASVAQPPTEIPVNPAHLATRLMPTLEPVI